MSKHTRGRKRNIPLSQAGSSYVETFFRLPPFVQFILLLGLSTLFYLFTTNHLTVSDIMNIMLVFKELFMNRE